MQTLTSTTHITYYKTLTPLTTEDKVFCL